MQVARRPPRDRYTHKICHGRTQMSYRIARTHERDPRFYSHMYCTRCRSHFPLVEFVWTNDGASLLIVNPT